MGKKLPIDYPPWGAVPKSAETKAKISQALKGVYTGENSPLFGRTHTEETTLLMSQARQGTDNFMYGKTHSAATEQSKLLMSLAKTGKVDNKTFVTSVGLSRPTQSKLV